MSRSSLVLVVTVALAAAPLAAGAATLRCPADSVPVGTICVDRYEASVWAVPAANTRLTGKLKKGTATLDDLRAGGTQLGCASPPYGHTAFPASFPETGNWTVPAYAASVAGTLPTSCVTWFQAEQACALAGKRLLTNQEWQRAAAGTPEGSSPCNVQTNLPRDTGADPTCVSSWGVLDMVGNVSEWVADWGLPATACSASMFGSAGRNCLTFDLVLGSSKPDGPGALLRGGDFFTSSDPGVFAVTDGVPYVPPFGAGFRCGR